VNSKQIFETLNTFR